MRREMIRRNAYNPFQLFAEFDRDFDRILRNGAPEIPKEKAWDFLPAADLDENEKAYFVSVDLPGVKKEDIKVEVHDGRLSVSGERKSERSDNGHFERKYGKFERLVTLPEEVDVEAIEAHFENGVLQLAIPKKELAKPKKVEIGIGEKKTGLWDRLLGSHVTQSDRASN
ncbi:MAG: heat-shock protein [Bdellovibrio sp. CG12_big_fil_rev_8_21_14_0_65_39_13]|nr:MAG: heat-shock protein [Bdellovibrio sp. CG22_combo_CG10-13_8_21_14_all_39_27]PIQ61098.1 MAG: heat-shock protein [Bdellovibrio sp. CG12_big_fil_rev_8_21_14_0_65_39_13]PIR36866.1 MAG: heat-shock protein [Bdellovibrio sp. CG11_big_fil_rev_8_21_14_0_20_39_38]PJB53994.1 MAG: heat-shock protein [Bdellovibrio sp. CG_4_9_14_3_um_filter_39_7]